jgi:hypothetical protein
MARLLGWRNAPLWKCVSRDCWAIGTICRPKRLEHRFTLDSRLILTTANLPTETENAPIVGASSFSQPGRAEGHARTGNGLRAGEPSSGDILPATTKASRSPVAFPGAAAQSCANGGWTAGWLADDTFPQMVGVLERQDNINKSKSMELLCAHIALSVSFVLIGWLVILSMEAIQRG